MATPAHVRSLTTAQQAFWLRSVFPEAKMRLGQRDLTWIGDLRPSELSDPYTTKIEYRLGQYPTVRILKPAITDAGEFVPHSYDNGTLCVHNDRQWQPSMLIVDTFLPWTVEWLWHWEIFQPTGEWFGDGDDARPGRTDRWEQLRPLPEAPTRPHGRRGATTSRGYRTPLPEWRP
jgi:hypothetical protein